MSKAYPERNYSTYSLGGAATSTARFGGAATPTKIRFGGVNTPTTPRFRDNVKLEFSEKGNDGVNDDDSVMDRFRRLKHRATDKWLARYILYPTMGVTFLLTLVLQIVSPELSINPINKVCWIGYESIPLLVFLGFFIIIVCPILCYLLYGIRDAYGVRNELIITIVAGAMAYIGFILFETVLNRYIPYFGSYLFAWIVLIMCHTFSITIPLLRTFKLRPKSIITGLRTSRVNSLESRNSEIMTNSRKYAQFMDVLGNSQQFEKYKECVAACFCTELILFLEEYQFLKLRVAQCCDPDIDMITSQQDDEESIQDDETIQEPEEIHVRNSNSKEYFIFSETRNVTRPPTPLPPLLLSTPCTISIVETISAAKWIPFPVHELRDDYLTFYETFFDQNSDLAINLRGSILTSVKLMIENDQFEISMFEKAREEVLALLYRNTYDRFLRMYGGGSSVSYGQNK
ncbi:288_t:CDS:2 [Ambispora leptoticha]|uniref:288_t:CDS:1 n=1 Tax=Ambispora leptoticha TaxID=144679 RepID=A0A9N9A1H5_9GLOM|nr:288_t:CDS:2 [Ambispora leptoticha]